jgi:hypothetical protein
MSASDDYKGIRSMPTNQKFRDNFDAIFKKKEVVREFCQYCGAGLGEHFREGEGTCRICDPGGKRGFQGK